MVLLKGTESLESWLEPGTTTAEYYAGVHFTVTDALRAMFGNPSDPPPPVLEVVLKPELERQYPELTYASAGFAPVTLAINYVLAQCVVRGLLSRPLLEGHRQTSTKAAHALWTNFAPTRAELREPWQAKEVLVALAFGNYGAAVRRFESEWKFDLARYENSHRTLIKLSYVLARCALGTGEKDFQFFAK